MPYFVCGVTVPRYPIGTNRYFGKPESGWIEKKHYV
jgi:hypothetical protein